MKLPELIEKAKRVFAEAPEESILTGQGLSRKELRALERAGVVEKMSFYKKRKYSNVVPEQTYAWELVKEE